MHSFRSHLFSPYKAGHFVKKESEQIRALRPRVSFESRTLHDVTDASIQFHVVIGLCNGGKTREAMDRHYFTQNHFFYIKALQLKPV